MKICGNRSSGDIRLSAGADYLGFIIDTPRSLRSMGVREAVPLFREASEYAKTVAVVTHTDAGFLCNVCSALEPDYIQLHLLLSADEVAAATDAVSSGIIALAKPERSFAPAAREIGAIADMVIVDTFRDGVSGGTGTVHDWYASRAIRDAVYPAGLMLSGGLNPVNVAEAVRTVEPAVVDVAGGVESGGRKSADLVRAFMSGARCRM